MSADTREHYLEAIAPQPTLRIRVEHSRTIKDGWSYSTTVEVDGFPATEDGAFDAECAIRDALNRARFIGEQERDIRNKHDNALKAVEATASN